MVRRIVREMTEVDMVRGFVHNQQSWLLKHETSKGTESFLSLRQRRDLLHTSVKDSRIVWSMFRVEKSSVPFSLNNLPPRTLGRSDLRFLSESYRDCTLIVMILAATKLAGAVRRVPEHTFVLCIGRAWWQGFVISTKRSRWRQRNAIWKAESFMRLGKKAGFACNQPDLFFKVRNRLSPYAFRSSVAPKEQATPDPGTGSCIISIRYGDSIIFSALLMLF
jgi:hypothetical protein